jgi:hypothetical protein
MATKVRELFEPDKATHRGWMVRCPACGIPHVFGSDHIFNGDHERPTFAPSLMIRHGVLNARTMDFERTGAPLCHATLEDGVWKYHADSAHALAGKTADAPDWETT